jgi:hypothetical protein
VRSSSGSGDFLQVMDAFLRWNAQGNWIRSWVLEIKGRERLILIVHGQQVSDLCAEVMRILFRCLMNWKCEYVGGKSASIVKGSQAGDALAGFK